MTYRFVDRLSGNACEVQAGGTLLGRFILEPSGDEAIFLNSVAISESAYCVPDLRGQWQLLQPGQERIEGTISRTQVLDRLDTSSILDVGTSIEGVISSGGTWLDALGVSPLVPGMSERAELQDFEKFLAEHLGHLIEVCKRPRTHLRVEVERTAVSRARRVATQASSYLAAHTEDWDRPTLRAVIPKRILSLVREDQYDIYENRVAARLVDHVDAYLSRRVTEVSRLLRLFSAAGDHRSTAGQGSHWRQRRVYQLWGSSIDAGDARRKAERTLEQLKYLKYSISGLMDSLLYREVPRRAFVGTTLTMTNILANDAHYRRVADIWLAWARLGLEQSPKPEKHFEEMQALCRCFGSFALLLVIRGLEQLGIEPVDLSQSLAGQEIELTGKGARVRLSWSASDGVLRLAVDDGKPLRIVPIPASVAMLPDDGIASLMRDADVAGSLDEITLVLYPSPSTEVAFQRMEPAHAHRLHALSHEIAEQGQTKAGFLPVSPWDLTSVERIARQLRWVISAPAFLAYPPTFANPLVAEFAANAPWLKVSGPEVVVVRAPGSHEALSVAQVLEAEKSRLVALEAEHADVSQQLRMAVRDGRASGPLNGRKKGLNAEIADLQSRIGFLTSLEADLAAGVAVVQSLLACPTCASVADPRRDFKGGPGHRFSCECPDCSTQWGAEACPNCTAWIPTLLPAVTSWTVNEAEVGWLDRFLGADSLAVPYKLERGGLGYVCPSCGHGRASAGSGFTFRQGATA
jgi:hypothetical protein